MGLIDFIAQKGLERSARQQPVSPAGFQPIRSSYRTGLVGHDGIRDFMRAYRSTAFSCIQKRAKAISTLTYQLHRRIDEETVRPLLYDHWSKQLWRNPTTIRHIRIYHALQWLEIWENIRGESYIITPTGPDPMTRKEVPLGFYPVPSSAMIPHLGPDGMIEHFDLQGADGSIVQYPAYQVIYKMCPGPALDIVTQYTRGYSRMQAAIADIRADEAVKDAIRVSMETQLPPWFVRVPARAKGAAKQDFKDAMNERSSLGNREPIGFLEGDWTIESVESMKPAKDAQILSMPYKQSICEAFDVPIGFFDTTKLNGKNTVDALIYMFKVFTIEQSAGEYVDTINAHFGQFEDGIELDFDRIDRKDTEAERLEEEHLLKLGLVTPNFIAKRRGLPAIPEGQGGDTYSVLSNIMPSTIMMQGGMAGLRAAASAGEAVPSITDNPEVAGQTTGQDGESGNTEEIDEEN